MKLELYEEVSVKEFTTTNFPKNIKTKELLRGSSFSISFHNVSLLDYLQAGFIFEVGYFVMEVPVKIVYLIFRYSGFTQAVREVV